MIRRPPRSTRTDTLFPYTTLFRARSEVEVGPVNGLCSIEIPLVGLGFGNLAPAAHLRQIPDRIRIKGIASIIPEEDVEIRRWPRVAGREGEGARHRIGDDVFIGPDIIRPRQNLHRLRPVLSVIGIKPYLCADDRAQKRLGRSEEHTSEL